MKLEQSFEVSAPIGRVWAALSDVEQVAPCLPGAAVTGRNEDGSYNGTFSIRIGPTSASYAGRLAMHDLDESGHRATMEARGTDKRGQGGAAATIVSSLRELGERRTLVEVSTDYRITGRLARFGRGGMIEDISEKLLRQFASSLQKSLEGSMAETAETEPTGTVGTVGTAAAATQAFAEPAPHLDPVPGAHPTPAPSELSGVGLLGSVLTTRLRRNPAPALGALAALVVALRLRRR